MNHTSRFADIFTHAGCIGYLLLGLSVIGLTIALVKVAQMLLLRLKKITFIDKVIYALTHHNMEQANAVLHRRHHPIARVMATTIKNANDSKINDDALHAHIDLATDVEINALQVGFRPLAAIAQLSPLIGLLGTVIGMIAAFSQLELSQRQVDPSLLAGGIWQALLTTALGLAIAIPLRAVLYYLEGETERIAQAMRAAVMEVLMVCGRSPLQMEKSS